MTDYNGSGEFTESQSISHRSLKNQPKPLGCRAIKTILGSLPRMKLTVIIVPGTSPAELTEKHLNYLSVI